MAQRFIYRFDTLLRVKELELKNFVQQESAKKNQIAAIAMEIDRRMSEVVELQHAIDLRYLELLRTGFYELYTVYVNRLELEIEDFQIKKQRLDEELKKITEGVVLTHREVLKFERIREIDRAAYKKIVKRDEIKFLDELSQKKGRKY
ncbi:hypothetical protein ACFL35_16080 [Candidatus Riflebacteria bacterium]